MLGWTDWDPAEFIGGTRLADGSGGFEARCERFLRQFARLGGRPVERSADGGALS